MRVVANALSTQTFERSNAATSRAETYACNAFGETRQMPLLPIFTAFNCPERMRVYTWEIETRSTSATSSGVMNLWVPLTNAPSPTSPTSHPLLRVMRRTVHLLIEDGKA
ncbi:hypothetical protein IMCC26256_11473 [Actinobacteria bacterium IMCC26256]|nr:hypothetical protein IMCC26256_11473 [Actinobacteria bacterium IMCC26256]